VASGELPDAATLGVIETARREAECAAARKAKVYFSKVLQCQKRPATMSKET
jgi:hypothetical protein